MTLFILIALISSQVSSNSFLDFAYASLDKSSRQRSLSAHVILNFSHVTSLRNNLSVWERQMLSDALGKQFLNASLSVKFLSKKG